MGAFNRYGKILASGSRTTTQTSAKLDNPNDSALHVILAMTAVGTGSVTVSIDGYDPASDTYYNLLTGAAVIANGTNIYKVGPALTPAAIAVANDYMPRSFRIVVTANNANPATYSCGYNLMGG